MESLPTIFLNIAATSTCNLACPSCPVGHEPSLSYPKGLMSEEMLESIIKKAKGECKLDYISLFSFSEPLLHPRIEKLVEVVNKHEVKCIISSNLNITRDYEQIFAAEPAEFIVSVSGFEQGKYGQTHRGGDIEKVKKNLVLLSEAWKKTGRKSIVRVTFHRYRGNLDDEYKMRQFTEDLGFWFFPIWATFISVEKNIKFIESGYDYNSFNEEDRKIIAKLVPPLDKVARVWKSYREKDCFLLTTDIAIDSQGNVMHCSEEGFHKPFAKFLETPLSEILLQMRQTDICKRCKHAGAHNYFNTNCAPYANPELAEKIEEIAWNEMASSYGTTGLAIASPLEVQSLDDSINVHNELYGQMTDKLNQLEQARSKESQLNELSESSTRLCADLELASAELEATEALSRAKNQELEALLESRSWRYTNGLRRASAILKKIRH